ncbi:MAG TPA: 3-hydroxyacyl-CoA dehydrogenase NAD-binding domain-containing protein [Noviherbaspirillum sp.]|uniref:3-hydroxyacyl-CoA dehydrogenase NAD-binding domain-containing protein n=1 Tax=Noviherbaspirillum sp. TaxID=1926288 RepID=UPI002B46972B|nr:3-hydroxyacyl-CoA dehydrogenase NAD-binding domain-containing protein [Noviherbaspirillum sp.]HJV85198.1 3-hydroxyacyl-CoA dehydrogenase NAD-binding domain-containing protein [Noviherbaspirillum sp.]
MEHAEYTVDRDVAVITLNNPPINGLGLSLRRAIITCVDRALADDAVRAIVLIGSVRAFSGGADIKEFGTPKSGQEPNLLSVIRVIESASKPVVAAIAGACMGGGLELALGCHFRVTKPDAQIALPEVKLGILPGAGGTQRLPRLVGLDTALNMIVSGNPVPAAQLKATALFDAIIEGDLLEGALEFARKVVAENRPLKRVRDIKINEPLGEAYLQFARNTISATIRHFPAPLKCLEAVAAAYFKPFDEGMTIEREAFLWLMNTPESRALRHAFIGERAASKIPDVPADTPTRPIHRVAVIGAGTMGGGIAMNFLNAGIPVVMLEMKQEALDRGIATIRKNYENTVKKGKLTAEKMDARMILLAPTLSYDDIKDCDLVIEAVFEDIGVKEQVFKKLDEVMKQGAILASNTSTLDVNRIASFTKRPQDVVGMHFFSPANVMRLLEVVRGEKTGKDVLATVMQLAKKIKKVAVVSGVCDGFIGNRMLKYYRNQANELLDEGASPQQIDRALENWGMAMGPFRMGDLAGLDIGWSIRKRLYAENPNMKRSVIADQLCELGRFGQKTGKGWYRYEPGKRDALPDPQVEEIIAAARQSTGITPRKVSDEEIVERCIFALVNEGARILEEGIAARASDIDMVYLTGYGFPAHRGGPMLYAETVGLANVVEKMRRFAAQRGGDAAFWKPADSLVRLAQAGESFN